MRLILSLKSLSGVSTNSAAGLGETREMEGIRPLNAEFERLRPPAEEGRVERVVDALAGILVFL